MHERIKKARTDRNLTQQAVANVLKINLRVYHRYESGEREMPIHCIKKLAEYYNLSLDYLTGLTDEEKPLHKNLN